MLYYQVVDQVLCLIASPSISFASEAPARTFMALLILDILKVTCDIFERKTAQDLLAQFIATFFSCFDCSTFPIEVKTNGVAKQTCVSEMRETFTASLAYNAYIPLCKCLGDTYMATTLDKNNEMIWQLCCSVDKALSNHTPLPNFQPVFVLSDKEYIPHLESRIKPAPVDREKVFDHERNYSSEVATRKDVKCVSFERAAPVTRYSST